MAAPIKTVLDITREVSKGKDQDKIASDEGQIMRGKEWQRDYEFQERERIDPEGIEKVRFNIENLLSQDNLMDNDSVKVLQETLNKYLFGSDFLRTDGQLGSQTLKSIDKYKQESKYWGGHSTIFIDPLKTARNYEGKKNQQETVKRVLRHFGAE
jgi:hypothetical protein